MPVSLHAATVPHFQRFVSSVGKILDKAEAHCADGRGDLETLAQARLCDDMWNFAKQVQQVCHHSQGAITGVRARVFSPLPGDVPHDFASLRAMLDAAKAELEAVSEAELESLADESMEFRMGETRIPFTVSNFLLGFSVPNFYFHVTTAYGILRNQGVGLGKLDYLGGMPGKRD